MASPKWGRFPCPIEFSGTLENPNYDSVVLVAPTISSLKGGLNTFTTALQKQQTVDKSIEKEGCVLAVDGPTQRLVYSPTGALDREYDDVRRFNDAAIKGIKRAISAGSKKPMLAVVGDKFPNAVLVSILGALEALYVPLQYREDETKKMTKVNELGVYGEDEKEMTNFIRLATALESGRFVSRDIGGGDPERMAPPMVQQYVDALFANSSVKVETIEDPQVFENEYPLFAAVNRAASVIPRHTGRIIFLRYEGEGPITKTLMPVGKGITYDTGGADIKAGGVMAGMSRDKCGAASVAGFFQVLNLLRPKGIKAIGALAVARNSVGENCYVSDEIIKSRAGLRIRIGNTDAEGRMVMADVLCKMKELAKGEVNPHLFTIATLTGHACIAVGSYTAAIDNGPARLASFTSKVQSAGESLGDMIEISTVRREDFNFIKSTGDGEDLLQCNNAPSTRTPRGHQFPVAFLIESSGLDKHSTDSSEPLKYTHFDIAGSAGDFPLNPTG